MSFSVPPQDLCVSVVAVFVDKSTTETQSSPRPHRELEIIPTDSERVALPSTESQLRRNSFSSIPRVSKQTLGWN